MLFSPFPPWYVPPDVPTPADPPSPDPVDEEDERVRSWRTQRFEELGLPYPLALELAIAGVDWHRVEKAVRGGMTLAQVESVFL